MVELVHIARLRLFHKHRCWDRVSTTLEDFASSIGWRGDGDGPHKLDTETAWTAHLAIHYLLLRSLWDGRIGNDLAVKSILKRIYLMMDDLSEKGVFSDLRANGGIIEVGRHPRFRRSLSATPLFALDHSALAHPDYTPEHHFPFDISYHPRQSTRFHGHC